MSDWSIDDLLQIMQVTKKTGSLDIAGDRRGRLHFRDGNITGAELNGAKGSYTGSDRAAVADILYVLSTLEEGSFAVGPADGPEGKGWSVEEVVAEVEVLRSLEGEVIDAGLFEATGVRLRAEMEEKLAIDPEDWRVLVSLVQPFTFTHLESKLGRGGAVRVFHTLHRLGVAEPIDGEEAADWLDRLAEDISPDDEEPTWLDKAEPEETEEEPAAADIIDEPEKLAPVAEPRADADMKGVSAPASTTLTDGVYDEIRRLRSRVADNR
ncbi:MAG: DUF4388 domain-containing protein [Actinobacteria bacterium]|nr:DUF4388 domain-containing protein [Actinomycetota bacterium]